MSDNVFTRGQLAQLKHAEFLSTVGALVLGVGIGVIAASTLSTVAFPLLLVGIVSHGWGMLQKHRLQTLGEGVAAWWDTALYWVCWLAMGTLLVAVAWTALVRP